MKSELFLDKETLSEQMVMKGQESMSVKDGSKNQYFHKFAYSSCK